MEKANAHLCQQGMGLSTDPSGGPVPLRSKDLISRAGFLSFVRCAVMKFACGQKRYSKQLVHVIGIMPVVPEA